MSLFNLNCREDSADDKGCCNTSVQMAIAGENLQVSIEQSDGPKVVGSMPITSFLGCCNASLSLGIVNENLRITLTQDAGGSDVVGEIPLSAIVANAGSVSSFSISGPVGGIYTIMHDPGDGSGPESHQVNGCCSSLFVSNNPDGSQTVTHRPYDGSEQTSFVVPAPGGDGAISSFTITDNTDGSFTVTHDPGDGSAVYTQTINVAQFDLDVATVSLVGGVATFTQDSGPDVVLDICAIVAANCNASLTLVDVSGVPTLRFRDNAGNDNDIALTQVGEQADVDPDEPSSWSQNATDTYTLQTADTDDDNVQELVGIVGPNGPIEVKGRGGDCCLAAPNVYLDTCNDSAGVFSLKVQGCHDSYTVQINGLNSSGVPVSVPSNQITIAGEDVGVDIAGTGLDLSKEVFVSVNVTGCGTSKVYTYKGSCTEGGGVDTNSVSQMTVINNPDGSLTVTHKSSPNAEPVTFIVPAPGATVDDSESIMTVTNNPDGSLTVNHRPDAGQEPVTFNVPANRTVGPRVSGCVKCLENGSLVICDTSQSAYDGVDMAGTGTSTIVITDDTNTYTHPSTIATNSCVTISGADILAANVDPELDVWLERVVTDADGATSMSRSCIELCPQPEV